jgi:DNA-directed RNA polymerase subunit RPC12/RpoP
MQADDSQLPGPPTANKQMFPCEQCGSALEFKPGSDTLRCPHCGHTQALPGAAGGVIHEHDFSQGIARARRQPAEALVKDGHNVQCEGCGAQTVVAGQAARCPFCGSPVVMAIRELGEIFTPESLLPFKLDARAAKERYLAWVGGLWFAPSDLKRLANQHGMDGVYMPYWCYDSNTSTRYRGERGEHYYVSESYKDDKGDTQTRQVRHTRWHNVSGTVEVVFDDVLVCGTETLPRKLLDKLEPWDLPELRAFDAGYLSGFIAERYKIGLEDGFTAAEARMVPKIRSAIEQDIGGDDQRIGTMNIHHRDVRFKHLLLPLWISSFRYKEKAYRFIVNARSGQVSGERPWSVVKIVLLVLAVIAVIAAIVVLVKRNQ